GGPLFERADELLDAGDLRGLSRLARLGALHVVPARVVSGERALRRHGDTAGGEGDGAERTDGDGAATGHRLRRPERPAFCGRGCAAAVLGCRSGIRLQILVHAAPSAGFTSATVTTFVTTATDGRRRLTPAS